MPRSKTKLTRYAERLPLFTRYNLEPQIDRIYERKAPLPSGGSIVIDSAEALTAIDVNSGRATQRGNHDESIFEVNVEAAHEVARQLRLRDIGGLVVVDFIDMRTRKHQSKLEKVMRDAMKVDKARYTVGKISPNGLLEINRQRIRQALHQRTHRPCPLCHGAASIPSAEFAATALLGRVEARVAPGMIEKATVAVHPEIADALQNIYRARLAALEQELDLRIEVISAANFSRTEERIDYRQREAAVAPRIAALSSSDLATSAPPSKKRAARAEPPAETAAAEAPAEPPAEPPAGKETPKRPARKRRRRRKSAAKKPAETAAAKRQAEGSQRAAKPGSGEQVSEKAAEAAKSGDDRANGGKTDGKPARSRRRRRGGRRTRKTSGNGAGEEAPASGAAAPAEAAAGDASDLFDDAKDWNAGFTAAPPSAGPDGDPAPAEAAAGAEKPATRRRRRAPRKKADAEAQPSSAEAQPSSAEAWQSPLTTQPPGARSPARRSPLRRDRSTTLRWQWWGGTGEDADAKAGGGDSPSGAGDSEDP